MAFKGAFKYLIILMIMSVANLSYAHRFYASFSQVEMQPAKGTIEITHRLFTHDITDLLQQYQGGNAELEHEVVENFLREYIIQAFALYDNNGGIIPLTWIDVEITLNDIFVYQEAALKEGQQSLIIADRILMDLFDDQSNTVNLKLDGKVKSHTFERESSFYKIDFAGPSGEVNFNK